MKATEKTLNSLLDEVNLHRAMAGLCPFFFIKKVKNLKLQKRYAYQLFVFPKPGESMEDAVRRECIAAREGVAVMDASTLGKIDIRGPDAAIFLDRIYTNLFSTLPEGQCRYGLMCKADGIVFDDGVTTRLGKNHFLMTF